MAEPANKSPAIFSDDDDIEIRMHRLLGHYGRESYERDSANLQSWQIFGTQFLCMMVASKTKGHKGVIVPTGKVRGMFITSADFDHSIAVCSWVAKRLGIGHFDTRPEHGLVFIPSKRANKVASCWLKKPAEVVFDEPFPDVPDWESLPFVVANRAKFSSGEVAK